MKDYVTKFYDNLRTVEETSFFIKNFESYLAGSVNLDSLIKSYSFIGYTDIEALKNSFPKLRTNLISRKKVKIYTPITVSSSLIKYIFNVLKNFSKCDIVLEPILETSIVAGIKFNLDGKIYNLTIEKLNSQ